MYIIGKEYCYLIDYYDSLSVDTVLTAFNAVPNVELAEPDIYLTPFSIDTYFNYQHSLDIIKMTQVWDDENLHYYGNNIKVGVVDSGIDLGFGLLPDHEDLIDNLYDDGHGNHGYNAYAYIQQDSIDIYYPHDRIGHGTAIAGESGATGLQLVSYLQQTDVGIAKSHACTSGFEDNHKGTDL